jgi:uncharacterized protein YjeT (DUF2065 family)
MTDAQIFQLLGIVYLAVGIGILINPAHYKKLMAVFSENPPVLYLSGLAALVVGYLLVRFHNVWPSDWPVIITIIGWVALFKGLFLLLLPDASVKVCRFFEGQMTKFFHVWAIVMAVVGALLAWLGFFAL